MKFKVFGEFLKTHREQAGLTQLDLARGLGYNTSQMISNSERGICALPATCFVPLAKLLGVPIQKVVDAQCADHRQHILKAATSRPQKKARKTVVRSRARREMSA